jgi:sporulation protein YlmC with PRC-barrel domain
MNKAVLLAAALLFMPLPAMSQQQSQQSQDKSQDRESSYSERDSERGGGEDLLERLSRSDLRDRLSSAIERVEGACGNDIERFCSEVTPGGGRIASCMQAYSDQLSRRCQFTLQRSANRIQQAVEKIADTCMTAVQQQCGETDNVGQCVQQKRSSLPQSCQTILAALQTGQALAARAQGQAGQQSQGGQALAHLRGMPVFSSDGRDLGQVVQVERGPDGKIQSVQIQIGRLLGIGEKTITVDGGKLEQLQDRIRLMMSSDQVRSLPEAHGDAKSSGGAQR